MSNKKIVVEKKKSDLNSNSKQVFAVINTVVVINHDDQIIMDEMGDKWDYPEEIVGNSYSFQIIPKIVVGVIHKNNEDKSIIIQVFNNGLDRIFYYWVACGFWFDDLDEAELKRAEYSGILSAIMAISHPAESEVMGVGMVMDDSDLIN